MNAQTAGRGVLFKWTKEYLIQILSSGRNAILKDPNLVKALHQIDRKDFVPPSFKDRAYDDIEIEIGFSERLNRPTLIASMLAYLQPKEGGKYLDLGTGTGYAAAVLSSIAGDSGAVYSIERIQMFWEQARDNMRKYSHIRNLKLIYRDGLSGLPNQAPFDGIHVSFSVEEIPDTLKMQLKTNGGRLVCPMTDHHLKVIVRKNIDEFEEEVVPGFTVDKAKPGTA